jgi:hypothetical protein
VINEPEESVKNLTTINIKGSSSEERFGLLLRVIESGRATVGGSHPVVGELLIPKSHIRGEL